VTNFLLHLVGPDGRLRINDDDEIIRATNATGLPGASRAGAAVPAAPKS
jgi:hypothetical protein